MNIPEPSNPVGFEKDLTVEHILLSITVVSNQESCHQFDDISAHCVTKALMEYHGVQTVDARVLYEHTKIEEHPKDCECGRCTFKMERETWK